MIYTFCGQEYLITIDNGKHVAREIHRLPGTEYKGLAKIDDLYHENAVFFALFEDIASLSKKDIDAVLEFFGVGEQ